MTARDGTSAEREAEGYRIIDQATWPRADLYRMFRGYERPHYATTTRLDVSHLIRRKADGISTYRACLFAIGAGIDAVPELRMRFRGDEVRLYEGVDMSSTVPTKSGGLNFSYLPFDPDFHRFDQQTDTLLKAAEAAGFNANQGERDDLVYLSCMPWLDYTSINNALPGPDECIPRVTWGKFVEEAVGWRMAMTLEVHHALVDGAHVGAFFEQVQTSLNSV